MYDFLIVGTGFSGCVLAERLTSQLGKTVLLIDRRPHLGGNAYDEVNAAGHLIHCYGPHIFHTNSAEGLIPLDPDPQDVVERNENNRLARSQSV